jgi:Kdo2-lipid IVA lauroyltransferase/acyltransferase
MRILLTLISKLSFAALYGVSTVFYVLNRYVIRYRYDVVRTNLRNAFPEHSESEINTLTEQVFRNLTDLLVEVIKGIGITREELDRRMIVTRSSPVQELIDEGKPLIYLTAHHCNWEWLSLYSTLHLPAPQITVYQPFHNQRFDDFMREARTRFGGGVVPSTELARHLRRIRKSVKTLALIVDQSPSRNERKYWTEFLNQDTAFIDGLDNVAYLTGMAVVFVRTKRRKRGIYDAWFEVLAEPPYEKGSHTIIARYARELEKTIQDDPSAWLWTHRRWKLDRPADDS